MTEPSRDFRVLLLWALAVIDAQEGDLTRLIKLLRSDWETSPSIYAAEQEGRKMLAALLERRSLKKKRGGQPTPLFKLSVEDRLERAENLARRLQHGQAIPMKDLFEASVRKLSPKQSSQWHRGYSSEVKIIRMLEETLLSPKAKPRGRTEAMAIAAEAWGVDPIKLRNFMDRKIGFGRGAKDKDKDKD